MIPLAQQKVLQQRFTRDLPNRLRIDFFGQKPSGMYVPGRIDRSAVCEDVRKLMHELAGLSPRISFTQHDIDDDAEAAAALGVQRVPAIVLRGQNNRTVRYYGNPRVKQFLAFVEALVLVSHAQPNLQAETLKTVRRVRSDVALKVFVTPACTHSPVEMITALRLAMESSHVKLDVIDVSTFPELIGPNFVQVTPMTVFNDQYAIPGVIEEERLAEDVLTTAQGGEPNKGGDPKRMTPVPRPQPRQQQSTQRQRGPRTGPGGLYIPR